MTSRAEHRKENRIRHVFALWWHDSGSNSFSLCQLEGQEQSQSKREGCQSGEKISTKTSEDMASEERKVADLKIKETNFFNSLGEEEQQAETDAFQDKFVFRAALVPYPLFRENAAIDKRILVVLMSL